MWVYDPAVHIGRLPLLAVLAAALTACSGNGGAAEPTSLPPITTSASPTPTPTAPTVPVEATAATPEGSIAFTRFFYTQLEKAYATADPGLIAALGAPGCRSCANYIGSLTALRNEGGRVPGYTITVVGLESLAGTPGSNLANVLAVLSVSEYVEIDPQGREIAREPAQPKAVRNVDLIRTAAGWQIKEVTVQ